MLVYVSKVFTAKLSGTRIKQVACEKCCTEFQYQLVRTGVGRASAHYYAGQEAAKLRAEKAAQRNLAKRLERDMELVPCPACRWVNSAAIEQFRKTKYRGWYPWGALALFIAALIDFFIYRSFQDFFHKQPTLLAPELGVLPGGVLAMIIFALAIQWIRRRRINPNKWSGGGSNVPPGTPPALTAKVDGTGQAAIAVIPSNHIDPQADVKWATFRPGQISFEPLCCQCLDQATTVYKMPITLGKVISVPFCQPCLRRLRWQWLRWCTTIPLVGFATGWGLFAIPSRMDPIGRNMGTVCVGAILAIVGLIIADRWVQPYRAGWADQDRGIARIRFKNPAYTALLIRRAGQADGLHTPVQV